MLVDRYLPERLQSEILETYSAHLKCAFVAPASGSFEQKILSVHDFLPESIFNMLRNAADRQDQPQRVHVPIHKRGATISYHDLHYSAPEIIAFYLSPQLHEWCSLAIGERVRPTPINDLSSCSILIYDQPSDHIGWHYDYDFYHGRHFTALLSLVNTNAAGNGLSSARLMTRINRSQTVISTGPNTLILFEGAYVFHRVTPLQEGERRVILSMTFCTNPSSTALQSFERRIKDVAYFGRRAFRS